MNTENTKPTPETQAGQSLSASGLLGTWIQLPSNGSKMVRSGSGDAEKALCLLLRTDQPNIQGDTSSLSLARELMMQLECQDCVEMALKAHTYLILQKYQRMLSQWKAAGCPDPGSWPDLYTDSFLVSYLRMAEATEPNDRGELRPAKRNKP
jgi:hypothetical protein